MQPDRRTLLAAELPPASMGRLEELELCVNTAALVDEVADDHQGPSDKYAQYMISPTQPR